MKYYDDYIENFLMDIDDNEATTDKLMSKVREMTMKEFVEFTRPHSDDFRVNQMIRLAYWSGYNMAYRDFKEIHRKHFNFKKRR